MATTYEPAPAVSAIAAELIPEHHVDLVGAPILFVFISPAPKSRGRVVLGRARKVSGLNAFLVALAAGEVEPVDDGDDAEEVDYSFFVMEIAKVEWLQASAGRRRALVDHELCHMAVDEDGKLRVRGHDLEEFNDVVRRHGLWEPGLEQFAGVCASVAE